VDSFLEKLKSGEITPEKLSEMTSAERKAFFTSFLGADNAHKVNADFESKLLLKNQKLGIINWAKKAAGIKKNAQRDIVSVANRMTEILKPEDESKFLADLAERRLGVGVTVEEAGKIADLAKRTSDAKDRIKKGETDSSPESIEYAKELFAMKEYVKGLKVESKALSPKEYLKSPWQMVKAISGTFKSAKASIDASFATRQGFVTLLTKPKIWGETFLKSFDAWKNELKGIDGKAPVVIDIFSKPNFYNGKYKDIGIDVLLETEEAFPTSYLNKIPGLGRLYSASMSAYNGALLRMRTLLADRFIADAESMGVTDLKNSGIGNVVNSMTGRGKMPLTKGQADTLNVILFSSRYFKAQVDVLTAGLSDSKVRGTPAQKTAVNNLLRIVSVVGGVLLTAKLLDKDSVDLDPRSTKFGKVFVRVGDKRVGIDVTGGYRSLIILASRLTPFTTHNGKMGLWWKSSKGRYYNMWDNKWGALEPSDFAVNFLEGKLAPFSRVILDTYKQTKWDNEKPTIMGELFDLISPISVTNATKTVMESKDDNLLLGLLLAGLNLLGAGTDWGKKKKDKRLTKPRR